MCSYFKVGKGILPGLGGLGDYVVPMPASQASGPVLIGPAFASPPPKSADLSRQQQSDDELDADLDLELRGIVSEGPNGATAANSQAASSVKRSAFAAQDDDDEFAF